ncbi:MAG: hypothetical protein AMJ91_02955 [candidate division Zixibacteria bacterium SM23_73_3]|nr:MAG: hypothetical protein AMJ91_02955 [candidate division Zixibacteria bacterium SM23_73_3]
MKILVLIFFFLLVLLSIVAVLFMLASVFSRVRRGKSNPVKSPEIKIGAQKQIIPSHMLVEYYGDLKKTSNGEPRKLFEKGLSFKQKRKFLEAIDVFEKCLNGDLTPEQKTGLLVTAGNCYFALDKLDLAQTYYEKADRLSRESDNKNGRLSCLINLGQVHAAEGNWDGAIRKYHQAIGLDQKLSYTAGEAIDLNTLALFYENKGDLKSAMTHYTASRLIFEKLKDRKKMELVENNIKRVINLGIEAKIED